MTAARGKQARKRKPMPPMTDQPACGVRAWAWRAWAGRLAGRSWSKSPSASRLPAFGLSSPQPRMPPVRRIRPCVRCVYAQIFVEEESGHAQACVLARQGLMAAWLPIKPSAGRACRSCASRGSIEDGSRGCRMPRTSGGRAHETMPPHATPSAPLMGARTCSAPACALLRTAARWS